MANHTIILQSDYERDPRFSVSRIDLFNATHYQQTPHVPLNMAVMVVPLWGAACCNMYGHQQQLQLQTGRFYLVHVLSDLNDCYFNAGLSGFLYIYMPPALLETLSHQFRDSGSLQALMAATSEGATALIGEDHQVITPEMATLIRALIQSEARCKRQQEAAFQLTFHILERAFRQCANVNAHQPQASLVCPEEYEAAEAALFVRAQRQARRVTRWHQWRNRLNQFLHWLSRYGMS